MYRALLLRLLLTAGALALGGALWLTAVEQRSVADRRAARMQDAETLLDTTLYQELEAGLSNEAPMHRLQEFLAKEATYDLAFVRVERASRTDPRTEAAVADVASAHSRWLAAAKKGFETRTPTAAELDARHGEVEDVGAAVATLRARISAEESAAQSRLAAILFAIGAGLSLLLGVAGSFVVGRRSRAAKARALVNRAERDAQAEFVGAMQIVQDEHEAHELVRRHVERSLPGSSVVVLNRNNSANRLEAATPVDPEGPLAERLNAGAEPKACVAVRLGATHSDTPDGEGLLRCTLCGKDTANTCTPLLVSGEVIGSVLVQRSEPLDAPQIARVTETVAQASPVLGNLRNLAIAEMHAATDALTGLPNRRALNDTMRRMVAHAGRTLQPLTALALDLDHFKRVNDRFGHEKGDDVLAAVGRLLAATLRESDFAARAGGEEFFMLLPDTDSEGGLILAHRIRTGIAQLEIAGVDCPVTGSIGLATFPLHGTDSETLLRKADRALYAAKEAGRDRVHVALVHGETGERLAATT